MVKTVDNYSFGGAFLLYGEFAVSSAFVVDTLSLSLKGVHFAIASTITSLPVQHSSYLHRNTQQQPEDFLKSLSSLSLGPSVPCEGLSPAQPAGQHSWLDVERSLCITVCSQKKKMQQQQ